MTTIYQDTDGNLGELALALIDDPAAWSEERPKFKTPEEFVISALRGLGDRNDHWAVHDLEAVANFIQEHGTENIPGGREARRMVESGEMDSVEGAVVGGRILITLRDMGQFPFGATSPAGWPDEAYTWANPDSVLERVDWADAVSTRIPSPVNPVDMAAHLLGPAISAGTRFHIQGAETTQQGIGLLLASPEFQRR